jgi:hypothetical protein
MKRAFGVLWLLPLFAACNSLTGADQLVVGDGDDGSGPSSNASSGSGPGPGAGGAGTGGGEPLPPPVSDATGVTIREVAVYQAVKSVIVSNGQPVTPDVTIVAGRPAIVRVFVDVQSPSGAPVTARLVFDDGTELEETMVPTASSTDGAGQSTYNFAVPGEAMRQGMRYRVELREGTETSAGPNPGATVPAPDSTQPLLVRAGHRLKITIVPIRYDNDGSGRMPQLGQNEVDALRDYFFAMYPTRQLELDVGPTFAWSGFIGANGSGWDSLLNSLSSNRTSSPADFDEFYYGMFRPTETLSQFCGGGCVAGLGYVGDPNAEFSRASIGLGYAGGTALETAAHEVGHNHGRNHSPCGGASGADGNYPHSGGGIGVWGLDILTGSLKSPSTYKDIMGYCEPNWISDYVYERFYDFNAAINGASIIFPEGDTPSYEPLAIGPAGVGEWLPEVRPTRPLMGSTRPVTIELDDGTTKTVDAIFHAYDHLDGGVYLLPKQGPRIRTLTTQLTIGGQLRRVVTTR